MAPTAGILHVTMEPKPSLPAAQFHDWYNNDHGPTRLRALPWFQNGFRYRANDGDFSSSKPEWMAIYDIEDMDNLTKDEYTSLRKLPAQAQRERDTMKQITVDRRFYDLVSENKSEPFKRLEDVENEGEKNVMVAISYPVNEGLSGTLLEKLDEHVLLLSKVPGWRRTRKFETSTLDLKEGKAKEVLVLLEYAPENGLRELKTHEELSVKRRDYDLYYTFGPAPRDLASLDDNSTVLASSTDGLTKSFPTSSSSSEHKYPALQSYITTPDSVTLPYHLSGSPSPTAPLLICINSILTDYTIWDNFVDSFHRLTNNKYRILRFNSRGRSTLPSSSISPITVDTLTDDIITILDALRVKTASVIGVSLGGATALNAALRYPNRITAFVSCDTNSAAPAGNSKAWGERIKMAEDDPTSTSSSQEPVVGSTLAEITTRRWFVPASYDDVSLAPKLQLVNEMVARNSLDGFRKSVNALYEYDFRAAMKGFEGKGAFLVGAKDGVLPKTMGDMAASLGKGVHLEVVEGAGHLPMVERGESVAVFVKGFLEG